MASRIVCAAESEHPDDLELVRLILARQRRLGADFGQAWATALQAIPPDPNLTLH